MKRLLMTAGLLAAVGAGPAAAHLQLGFSDGLGHVVFCADQTACDFDGAANNLLKVQTSVGAFNVVITAAVSTFGAQNTLSFSNGFITYNPTVGAPAIGHLSMIVSDNGFTSPIGGIDESASVTFLDNIGGGQSTLKFWADGANTQGAAPLNTPGALLDTVNGTPTTITDSFAGTLFTPLSLLNPFSMTEGANLAMIAGASTVGFNQTMTTSAVPEPKTWAMLGIGFGLMAMFGLKRSRKDRLAVAI